MARLFHSKSNLLRITIGMSGICFSVMANGDPLVLSRSNHPRCERNERTRMASKKTVIVTGASQGIGAAVVQAFLDRGYNVVATSRAMTKAGFAPSSTLALVDGDIGQAATGEKVPKTAIPQFGSIDHVGNNAGLFPVEP